MFGVERFNSSSVNCEITAAFRGAIEAAANASWRTGIGAPSAINGALNVGEGARLGTLIEPRPDRSTRNAPGRCDSLV